MEDYKKKYEEALERAKVTNPGTADYEVAVKIFPELKENKDERTRKAILELVKQSSHILNPMNQNSMIAWLEKQGKQKPVDKVEPKFKIGDYIINGHGFIMQIDGINGNMYIYHVLDNNDHRLKHDITKTEESCHLWTIQDAKDGDVLIVGDEDGEAIAICGKYDMIGNNNLRYLYDDRNGFLINVKISKECLLHPATKEQRDLLFIKMKEAGYEWDTEKKELKKIEQKSAWSEEDEKRVTGILMVLESWDSYHVSSAGIPSLIPDYVSWLKSLKERLKGE